MYLLMKLNLAIGCYLNITNFIILLTYKKIRLTCFGLYSYVISYTIMFHTIFLLNIKR